MALGRELARLKKQNEANPRTRQEVLALIDSVEAKVAWQQLVRMIESRDRTANDVAEKLKQQGFGAHVAHEVVQRAEDSGLISNKRFASAFVRSKISAGWGIQRIEQELKRRGVDVSSLEGWPYEYLDPDDERARATRIASKKVVKEPNRYAKMVRFLLGRGFSYGIATSVADDVVSRH